MYTGRLQNISGIRKAAHQEGGELGVQDVHEAAERHQLRLHPPGVIMEVGLLTPHH